MQTSSAISTSSSRSRCIVLSGIKAAAFAAMLWAATAAGAVPIPGTPVPITLQTFIVMLAALSLNWQEAGASIMMYLAAGAMGLPVFAGGASTLALVGPSAGFLFGFLPGAVITALLKGKPRTEGLRGYVMTAVRYLFAAIIGCIVVDYLMGFTVQSLITGLPWMNIAAASAPFIVGDMVKATVAALAVSGLSQALQSK
ncbi:biotin transporter BioY [Bifidobacterium tsurumiense]|uniref:Biotin transporter n=1 Tax=Bifidobacterium tsurumiense TaxID=356829 RepID=A0A087ECK1_9BIFI|nr:biotin transporter BioY [Bifidobacterium tsurumiense]KFJ05502.1 biotin synthase [Bifidobacterium tsurumiense]MDY4677797.1 biotin transporter BioY [Bifidobacterium tsurumiense]MSS12428.1 biotin transporter BioY [Bifidobacterium tsurumiense]